MSTTYYTLLTQIGLAKMTNAQLTQDKVDITHMAIGDANGAPYAPTGDETALKNERHRMSVSGFEIAEDNPNWIEVTGILQASVGGFSIHEVGLYDDEGDLVAIGNYPGTYKPVLSDGATMDVTLRTIIEVNNASVVNLVVDPTVSIASRKYVADQIDVVTTQLAHVKARGYDLKDFILEGETSHENAFRRVNAAIRQRAIETNFKDIPQLKIARGLYILRDEVKLSPIVKMKAEGQVKFLVDHPGTGIWICQEDDDHYTVADSSDYNLTKNSWNRGEYLNGDNGGFIFTTTYPNEAIALEIGRRTRPSTLVNDYFPVSRYVVNNFNAFGFLIGLKLNMCDHYLGRFENTHIEGCKTGIKFATITTERIYAGENFVFEGGILAASGYGSALGYCVDIDAPAVDVTFNDISFDFNKTSTVRVANSGCNVRFNHCYFEDGEDCAGLYELQAKYPNMPSWNAISSVSFTKCVALMHNPMAVITNTPYVNGATDEYIILNCSIDGLELRYHALGDLTNLDNRFAVKGKNVRIYDKKLNKQSATAMIHTHQDCNVLLNGDFNLTPVGTDIYTPSPDKYWLADWFSNLSGLTTVQDGDKKAIQFNVTNTSSNGIAVRQKQKLSVSPGDIYLYSFIYKTDKVSNATDITFGFDCYDESNNQLTTISYVVKTSSSSSIVDIDDTKYNLVRNMPLLKVPKNVTKIVPFVAVSNINGTFFRMTDIMLDKVN